MDPYLQETNMLNYHHSSIQKLLMERQWENENEFEKIHKIYNFVRDEIAFGYNRDDTILASEVLKDGYGQCNTKGTLFMALLRAAGVPCRLHGFTINKSLQKGAMKGLLYKLSPQNITHSWVEVLYMNHWYQLEGFILDRVYLKKLQESFPDCTTSFCGYGVASNNFQDPQIDWNANDTYIQKEGINQDFGVFPSPDEFFENHQQRLSPLKKWIYQKIGRKFMNQNIKKIRNQR